MINVVNLRQARKARGRDAAAAQAAANRVKHGQTKAAKQAAKLNEERVRKLLDGARRDDDQA